MSKILVVDDAADVRQALARQLRIRNHEVHEANGVTAAIEILNESFDLVLSDIDMPGPREGFLLARRIRNILPHTTVVLMTGNNYNESEAIAAGAVALVHKPFSIDEVLTRLTTKVTASSNDAFTIDEIEMACRNIGYDMKCGACAALFYTGRYMAKHEPRCENIERVAKAMALAWGDASKLPRCRDMLHGHDVDHGFPGSKSEKDTAERDARAIAVAKALGYNI